MFVSFVALCWSRALQQRPPRALQQRAHSTRYFRSDVVRLSFRSDVALFCVIALLWCFCVVGGRRWATGGDEGRREATGGDGGRREAKGGRREATGGDGMRREGT